MSAATAAERRQMTRRLRNYHGVPVTRAQAGDGAWLAARLARAVSVEAAGDYAAIAEELDWVPGERRTTLADLDQAAVERARTWARASHRAWPPRPTRSGWTFAIMQVQ